MIIGRDRLRQGIDFVGVGPDGAVLVIENIGYALRRRLWASSRIRRGVGDATSRGHRKGYLVAASLTMRACFENRRLRSLFP